MCFLVCTVGRQPEESSELRPRVVRWPIDLSTKVPERSLREPHPFPLFDLLVFHSTPLRLRPRSIPSSLLPFRRTLSPTASSPRHHATQAILLRPLYGPNRSARAPCCGCSGWALDQSDKRRRTKSSWQRCAIVSWLASSTAKALIPRFCPFISRQQDIKVTAMS